MLAAACCVAASGGADALDGDLMHLVPADCAIAIEVRDLDAARREFLDSPFFERFAAQRLAAEMRQWDVLGNRRAWAVGYGTDEGIDAGASISTLFARQALAAAWPDGDLIQTVFLFRFASADALAEAMEAYDAISQNVGELAVSHYKGRRIRHRRVAPGGDPLRSDHYVAVGDALAVSRHEALLRRVIDRADGAGDSLADAQRFASPRARAFAGEGALVFGWIDTRAIGAGSVPFAAPMRRSVNPITAALGRELHGLVAGFDHVALSVGRSGGGVRLAIDAPAAAGRETTALDFLIFQPNAPGITLASLPGRPGVVAQWQTDMERLNRAMDRLFPDRYRQRVQLVRAVIAAALGADLENGIVNSLGPDVSLAAWGEAVAVGADGRLEGLAIPTVAVLLQNRGRREFASRVDPLLRRYLTLLTLVSAAGGGGADANRASFYLDLHRGVSVGQVRMLGRSNPLGRRLWPSWAFVDDVFAIGIVKEAAAGIIDRRLGHAAADLPEALTNLPAHSGLVYIDAAPLARWLRANVPYLAERDTSDAPDEAAGRVIALNERIETADMFDHLLLVRHDTDGGVRLTVDVRPKQSLWRTP